MTRPSRRILNKRWFNAGGDLNQFFFELRTSSLNAWVFQYRLQKHCCQLRTVQTNHDHLYSRFGPSLAFESTIRRPWLLGRWLGPRPLGEHSIWHLLHRLALIFQNQNFMYVLHRPFLPLKGKFIGSVL